MELLFLFFLIFECLIYQGSCINQGIPSNIRLIKKKKSRTSSSLGLRLLGDGVIRMLTSFSQPAAIRALGLSLYFWYILCCTPRRETCVTEMKMTVE